MSRPLLVLRDGVAGGAAVDTALSRALLDVVADGAHGDCLRLWRPEAALAFSGIDRTRPGFAAASELARAQGFEPFVRLAGGHAAVYAPSLLAFVWTTAAPDARAGIEARFVDTANRVATALTSLGVDARIGAVPGEFCPGDYSVNARGRVKLMGVGQRVVRGAAHIGGVVMLQESAAVREVLRGVYQRLELTFDPASVGSVEAECGDVGFDAACDALLAAFGRDHELAPGSLAPELLARARGDAERYRVAAAITAQPADPPRERPAAARTSRPDA